jgi:hypothetical protein
MYNYDFAGPYTKYQNPVMAYDFQSTIYKFTLKTPTEL